jgi:hypothetical protein
LGRSTEEEETLQLALELAFENPTPRREVRVSKERV